MDTDTVILRGIVKADGSLEVEGKVPLPPGRVQLTVQPVPELPPDDPFWQRMRAIWDAQKAAGHVPRGAEQVEAERRALRDEWEERAQDLERRRQEGRGPHKPPEPAP
jgi:hypothetical protein